MKGAKAKRVLGYFAIWVMGIGLFSSPTAGQGLIFVEDFEGDLSKWLGKGGGQHHAIIVADPLRVGNNVVTFFAVNAGGDIYGSEVQVRPNVPCSLSFEYMGDPSQGGNPGNLGGFIGIAEDLPGNHVWLQGTVLMGGAQDDALVDDGQWHSYRVGFNSYRYFSPLDNTLRVMVEDYFGSGGVFGDAYFDNVELICADFLIDFKDNNVINPRSRGRIPMAIRTTSTVDGDPWDFDAWDIDASTLTFGPDTASIVHAQGHAEDVDGDGDLDMVVHFKTQQTGIACGDTEAILAGKTLGGRQVRGAVLIETVGCGRTAAR